MVSELKNRADGWNKNKNTSLENQVDEQNLGQFGYEQKLSRSLSLWTNWAIGFAFISPVVGLYTVVALGAQTAGPAWIWALPIVLIGQFFVALSYTKMASRWPLAGGIYQWSRRLVGSAYGWWAGWFYVWALVLTLSTVAYGGGFFLGQLIGYEANSPLDRIILALMIMAIFTTVNVIGLHLLRWVVNIGILCELVASIGVAIALIVFFREQPLSMLTNISAIPEQTTFLPAFLAALAISGWVLLGFDACGSIAEETKNPARDVPRAIVWAVVSVGLVEVLAGVALMLATPDISAVIAGKVDDPVSNAVVASFGSWAAKPFLAVVVIGFVACGIAVQASGVRVVYAFARDGMIPFSDVWSTVHAKNNSPVFATLLVAVLASLAFVYANVLDILVAFATGAYYICFLAPIAALLYVRLRGQWNERANEYGGGKLGILVNIIAVVWLVFEIINIGWPRHPELPWYQNWAFPVGMAVFGAIGLVFFLIKRPDLALDEKEKMAKNSIEQESVSSRNTLEKGPL